MSGKSGGREPLEAAAISVGMELPERTHKPDNVELFLYNAALWNAHRIHFDLPYATEVEGYPGLVIAGPQMGDWMAQVVDSWLDDDGEILQIAYSNRQAAYIGETLTAGGQVVEVNGREVSLELHIKNENGDVITPGSARVRLSS